MDVSEARRLKALEKEKAKPQQTGSDDSFNGACVTSCQTRRCSDRYRKRMRCWRPGGATTTKPGRARSGMADTAAYSDALDGQIGRSAALVEGCADRPLANPAAPSSNHQRALVMVALETGVTSSDLGPYQNGTTVG